MRCLAAKWSKVDYYMIERQEAFDLTRRRISRFSTVVASCFQGCSHVSFEHAEDGVNLPTLAICFLGKPLLH